MLAYFLRFRKCSIRKDWKSTFSSTPLSFDAPLQGNPAIIRITSHCQKLQSLGYIFGAEGLSLFKFWWLAPKMHVIWNKVRNGRSMSSKVVDLSTNRNRLCDFLLLTKFGDRQHRCEVTWRRSFSFIFFQKTTPIFLKSLMLNKKYFRL